MRKQESLHGEIFRIDNNFTRHNLVQSEIFFRDVSFSAVFLPRRFLESGSFSSVEHHQGSAANVLPWDSPNALLATIGELEAGQLPDSVYCLVKCRQYVESLVLLFTKALTSAVRLSG